MAFPKKHIVGIGAIAVAVAYAFTGWHSNSEDSDKQASTTEYRTSTDG
jgi:hypothetical protein